MADDELSVGKDLELISSNYTTDTSSSDKNSDSVKDKSYAWLVLAASFMCQVIAVGLPLSNGSFTPTLLQEFGGSRSMTAWVGSLHAGFMFSMGPVVGVLTDRFGTRTVVMAGGIISSVGIALSACATKLWMLYLLYGVFAGSGFSCSYIPAVTILAKYFSKWKFVAFSLSATGAGTGMLALPHIIKYFLDEYGLKGSFIMTAGVALQLVICGSIMKEPPADSDHKTVSTTQEFSILKDWRFLLFLLNNYLFNFGGLIIFVLIADYAQFRQLSATQGIYLISILGISNACGRALVAIFGVFECNNLVLYLKTCALSGAAIMIVTLQVPCPDPCFWVIAVSCAVYGLLCGVQLANLAIVTNAIVGVERLNAAYGITMFTNGAGAATGPPFAGFLKDVSGSYAICFYMAGGTIVVAGMLLIPLCIQKCSSKSTTMPRNLGETIIASIPALSINISPDDQCLQTQSLLDVRGYLSKHSLNGEKPTFSSYAEIRQAHV